MINPKNEPLLTKFEGSSLSWKHYLIYGFVGVVVAAEVVSAVLFIPNLTKRVLENNEKIAAKEVAAAEMENAVSVLSNLDESKVDSDLSVLTQTLPNEKKISGIVSSLTALASQSGAQVNQLELTPCGISTRSGNLKLTKLASVSCENLKLEKDVSGVPLSMQVLADEDELSGFTGQLHLVSPLFGISGVGYNLSESGKTAEITLHLFFQPVLQKKLLDVKRISAISEKEQRLLNDVLNQQVILP